MKATSAGQPAFNSLPAWVAKEADPLELGILSVMGIHHNRPTDATEIGKSLGVDRNQIAKAMEAMVGKGWITQIYRLPSGETAYGSAIWFVTDTENKQKRKQVKRSPVSAALDLVIYCYDKKGALFVYLILQHFEAPAIKTIATLCGMSDKDVRSALKWLEAEGWIQKIERPGGTNQYRVFFERVGAFRG